MVPSAEWFIARIEKTASPAGKDERQELYADFAKLGPEAEAYLLAAVVWAGQAERGRRSERRERDWYFAEVKHLQKQLNELADHDLISGGIDPEAVTFFQPYEVDCRHGRRTKKCRALREKVELLAALSTFPTMAKRLKSRMAALGAQIKALDPMVNPATAKPGDFCAAPMSDVGPTFTDAPPRPRRPGGHPVDTLQGDLLETVGEYLCRSGWTREKASDVVARLLRSVFGRATAEAGTVLRQWRTLRRPGRRGGSL